MKRILLLVIALVLLASCGEVKREPNYEEIAITKVKDYLLDPNSFELIKVVKDTVRLTDIMLYEMEKLLKEVKEFKSEYDNDVEYAQIYSSSYSRNKRLKYIESAKNNYDSLLDRKSKSNSISVKFDSINGTDNDSIVGFTFMVRGYAVNRLGNRMIGDFEVQFDAGYGFLGVSNAN